MKGKKKVLFLDSGFVWAGAQESLAILVDHLNKKDYFTSIACRNCEAVATRYIEKGLSVEILDTWSQQNKSSEQIFRRFYWWLISRNFPRKLVLKIFSARPSVRRLAEVLSEKRFKIVYGNLTAANDFDLLILASKMGFFTASHQRIAIKRLNPWVINELNLQTGSFVCNSNWTRERWIELGILARKTSVYYNFIPVPCRSNDINLKSSYGFDSNCVLAVNVGRLVKSKRVDSAIHCVHKASERNKNLRLLIVGEGPERENLKKLVGSLGIEKLVRFSGDIREFSRYLNQADMLLHTAEAEPFGRVVAEAMLSGTIVVGHFAGGVKELIQEGITGYGFLLEDSVNDAVSAIDKAISSSNEITKKIQKSAFDHVSKICGPQILDRWTESIIEGKKKYVP